MSESLTDIDWFRHFHQAATTELVVIIGEETDLQTESITLHELFQDLTKGLTN